MPTFACSSTFTSAASTTSTTRKIKIFISTIALLFLSCDHSSQLFPNLFVEGITAQGSSIPLLTTTSSIIAQRKRMSNNDNKNSASALGELKETIRSQKKEIARLTAKIASSEKSSKSSSSASHGGHGGDVELTQEELSRYLNDPFYRVGMQRVGWLGIFLASLSATALIMNVFEETLEKHIELALFVPLLAGHGGNTGGQTVGTILSALSAGTIKPSDAPKVVWKESMAGILSGSILGAAVAPIAYKGLGVSFHVAVVLFFTLPLVSMIASTLGSIIPFICVLLGLDPSVIAAPAMTSLVDVAGLMGYFMIANYIFKLFGLEL
mmetsp:Transcript_2265/g.4862  ORF Transcript_2265/g.4862 Transcript_2265/m.4862 type:complete len:324 (+) Transcript_2265:151-1122(+)